MIWAKSKDAVQTNRNQHFCYETVQIQDLSLWPSVLSVNSALLWWYYVAVVIYLVLNYQRTGLDVRLSVEGLDLCRTDMLVLCVRDHINMYCKNLRKDKWKCVSNLRWGMYWERERERQRWGGLGVHLLSSASRLERAAVRSYSMAVPVSPTQPHCEGRAVLGCGIVGSACVCSLGGLFLLRSLRQ